MDTWMASGVGEGVRVIVGVQALMNKARITGRSFFIELFKSQAFLLDYKRYQDDSAEYDTIYREYV